MIQRKVAGSAERTKKTKTVPQAAALTSTLVSGRAEFDVLVNGRTLFVNIRYDVSLDGWVWYVRTAASAAINLMSGLTRSFESAHVTVMRACAEYRPPAPRRKPRKKTK